MKATLLLGLASVASGLSTHAWCVRSRSERPAVVPLRRPTRMCDAADATSSDGRAARQLLIVMVTGLGVALQFEWRFFLGYVAGCAVERASRLLDEVTFFPGSEDASEPRVELSKVAIDGETYTAISWLPDD